MEPMTNNKDIWAEMTEAARKLAKGVNEQTLPGFSAVVAVNDAAYEVKVRKLKLGVDYDKEEEG